MRRRNAAAVLVGLVCLAPHIQAQLTYHSYVYDTWGDPVPSPPGYLPSRSISGLDLGIAPLVEPQDMCVDSRGDLYILDSGNNRVVVLDSALNLIRLIDTFARDGIAVQLDQPRGIFVDSSGYLTIADMSGHRVIVTDANGTVLREFSRPDSDIFPASLEYLPTKVLVDGDGNTYVLAQGFYYGAVLYGEDGTFLGFYGANRVQPTAAVLADYFWKQIMSQTQRDRMARYVPTEFSNFDIDGDGFIYTSSAVRTRGGTSVDEIRKLNPNGTNILRQRQSAQVASDAAIDFGDLGALYYRGNRIDSQFVDVAVDDDGLIFGLDRERGRVFEYDQNGELLAIFGGIGYQEGTLRDPVAVDSHGDAVVVLDRFLGTIVVFEPTEFGALVEEAVLLYNEGFYEQSEALWRRVLERNQNFELANVGIGKAMEKRGRYRDAMRYYARGFDRAGYSDAFGEYRTSFLRRNFAVFGVLGGLAVVAVFVPFRLRRSAARTRGSSILAEAVVYPFRNMIHPISGVEEMQQTRRSSLAISLVLLLLFWLAAIVRRQLTGFAFNYNRLEELNVLRLAAITIVPFLLWTIANWSVCTLFDGDGRYRDIWIISAYSLLPYVVLSYLSVALSNVITLEEGVFVRWIDTVGVGWSTMLVLSGLMTIHRYSFMKTVSTAVLTVIGVFLIILTFLLIFNLYQQVIEFVQVVFREVSYRL